MLPAAGRMEDLEYLLRRTKAQLAEGDLPAGRILVLDRGMDPAARQVALRGWSPTFICESAGTQARDAREMKRIYQEFL